MKNERAIPVALSKAKRKKCTARLAAEQGRIHSPKAVAKLDGGKNTQTITLEPKDFAASGGEALSSWKYVDLLSFRAYYDKGEKLVGS